MQSPYYRVLEILDSHGIDIDELSRPAQGKLIYDICKTLDIQVSQFKDNRTALYRKHGYKVSDALIRHRKGIDGEIYLSYINLGDVPLRHADTVKLARKLQAETVPADSPSRAKLEHGLTRNNLIHVHFIFSADSPPPEKVTLKGKEYPVETVVLGQVDRWKGKPYEWQLERAVKYHYKPGNIAGLDGHNKIDLKHQAYLEWFLEQRELYKLTRRQRQKRTVKLSWNKNIK